MSDLQTIPENGAPTELERLQILHVRTTSELDEARAELATVRAELRAHQDELQARGEISVRRAEEHSMTVAQLETTTRDLRAQLQANDSLRGLNDALVARITHWNNGGLVTELRNRRVQLRAAYKASGGFVPGDLDPSKDP